MSAIDTILNSMRGRHISKTRQASVKTLPVWLLAWRWYCRCIDYNRSRQQLRKLSDHQLADIGLDRKKANQEADRWPKLRV